MKIKTKKGLVTIFAVALLLCLALAVGITGAWYQAQRQATGTLSMDQGIIIDYKGFGQTPDEGIWTRETTTTFLLFDETNAQPGEEITVNAAGIRANEKSVNFYARVKLSYKFYNVSGETETEVTLANTSDLITASTNFFGADWVDGGGADGYYYYATGSTLNKFEKTATTFVDLFATDAKFIIEGAGFTLEDGDLESGGFVVGDTSINKIEVYLTLETLQGDATAEQAKALGWEITTGGTEGEKVVELTPEDYTSTTTTDETTGEEKTIYTPSETFVGKNPKYAFTFSLNDTDKTATITGPVGNPTELDIPSKLIVKGQDYTTTSIGKEAFIDCISLTSITISEGVESIEETAFNWCYSLTSITIPDSVTSIGNEAFSYCSSLTSVTIGSGVESIGEKAFMRCTSLTSVTIGSGVTSIGNEAFYNCTMLNKVNITDIAKWCEINFENDRATPLYYVHNLYLNNELITELIIPNSVTSIGDYAFYSCSGLTSITIPDSVTSIGDYAFYSCSGLTSITIPDSVTSIGNNVFLACSSLTSITIPDSVTNIGQGAFSGCSGLTSVTMGNSVKSIGEYAFNSCKTLESITIPNSVTYINNNTFNGCSSLTSITIPDSVTHIGQSAFYGCSGLTSVTIGSGVTFIGDNAFCDCSGLKTITIPNSVKRIEPFTFDGCSSLTSVTIGNSVKSIGRRAFIDCISLTSITIVNSVISIGEAAFNGCKGLTSITIPDSVTSIGEGAFGDCRSLEKIEVAQGNTKYSSVDSKGNQVNCLIDKDTNTLIAGCKNSVIPADGSVTSIGSWAFYGCSGLKTITIPNNVTSIGNRAFSDCSLTSITIPDSVTSIGNDAFFNCHNLTTTIGDGWVKVRDNTSVAASTFLRDIYYDIRRA